MFALWARDGLNILLSWYYISVIFLVGNVKWGFPQPCALSVWEQHHKRSKNLSKYSLRLIIKQPGSFTFGPRQAEIRPAVQKRRRADKDPPPLTLTFAVILHLLQRHSGHHKQPVHFPCVPTAPKALMKTENGLELNIYVCVLSDCYCLVLLVYGLPAPLSI